MLQQVLFLQVWSSAWKLSELLIKGISLHNPQIQNICGREEISNNIISGISNQQVPKSVSQTSSNNLNYGIRALLRQEPALFSRCEEVIFISLQDFWNWSPSIFDAEYRIHYLALMVLNLKRKLCHPEGVEGLKLKSFWSDAVVVL